MAVFGPSSDDPTQLLSLLGQCVELRTWASERDIVLGDDPNNLAVLDREIDACEADSRIGRRLADEVGCHLGTVIVKHVPGAVWRVWSNGHPVVGLPSGRDLDVIAVAGLRVSARRGSLMSIFTDAR